MILDVYIELKKKSREDMVMSVMKEKFPAPIDSSFIASPCVENKLIFFKFV